MIEKLNLDSVGGKYPAGNMRLVQTKINEIIDKLNGEAVAPMEEKKEETNPGYKKEDIIWGNYCVYCVQRKPLPHDSKFCKALDEPKSWICAKCGSTWNEWDFCAKCGANRPETTRKNNLAEVLSKACLGYPTFSTRESLIKHEANVAIDYVLKKYEEWSPFVDAEFQDYLKREAL